MAKLRQFRRDLRDGFAYGDENDDDEWRIFRRFRLSAAAAARLQRKFHTPPCPVSQTDLQSSTEF
jgi:hypothetical protein